MALLTKDAQEKAVNLLVTEGLVSAEALKQAEEEVAQTKQPLLATLTAKKLIDDEILAAAARIFIFRIVKPSVERILSDIIIQESGESVNGLTDRSVGGMME